MDLIPKPGQIVSASRDISRKALYGGLGHLWTQARQLPRRGRSLRALPLEVMRRCDRAVGTVTRRATPPTASPIMDAWIDERATIQAPVIGANRSRRYGSAASRSLGR